VFEVPRSAPWPVAIACAMLGIVRSVATHC
jgi:hypothetical protein